MEKRWALWKAECQWVNTDGLGMTVDEYLEAMKWIWDAGAEALMDAAGWRITECEGIEKCRCQGEW